MNSVRSNSWKYQLGLHQQVAKVNGLDNLSLWRELSSFLMYNHIFKYSCFKEEFLSSYGEAKRRRCSLRLRDISDRVVPVQNQDLETSLDPVLSQTPGAGVNKPEKTSTPVLSTEEKLLLDPEITDSKPEVGDKRSEVTENSSEVQIEDDDTKDESENDDDESLDEEDEEEDDLLQQLGILSIIFFFKLII